MEQKARNRSAQREWLSEGEGLKGKEPKFVAFSCLVWGSLVFLF